MSNELELWRDSNPAGPHELNLGAEPPEPETGNVLNLNRPSNPAGPHVLNLGADEPAPEPGEAVGIEINAVLPGPTASILIAPVVPFSISANLSPVASLALGYDSDIPTGPHLYRETPTGTARPMHNGITPAAWEVGQKSQAQFAPPWQMAEPCQRQAGAEVKLLDKRQHQPSAHWQTAMPCQRQPGDFWKILGRIALPKQDTWQEADPCQRQAGDSWLILYRRQLPQAEAWEQASPCQHQHSEDHQPASAMGLHRRASWEKAAPPGCFIYIPEPPEPPEPVIPPMQLLHLCRAAGLGLALVLGIDPCAPLPPIPRRIFIVIPEISVTRDGQPIPAASIDLSLDADSHSWAASLVLLGPQAIEAIEPDSGQPVILTISINSYNWNVIVDKWEEAVAFGQRALRIDARGITAELTDPWQLPESGTLSAMRTMHQLMDDQIPLDQPWVIDYPITTPDWLIPAGAWSWNNLTPLGVIHQAAQATGLVLVPHRTLRNIRIQPRYPVLPWAYATATPDISISADLITQYQRTQPVPTQANGIYVHGADIGGIIAWVKREGTAGERLASTQNHPLITDAIAARLLGGRHLADEHQQPAFRQITLPFSAQIPLGEIGQLLHIDAGAIEDRSIINSVQVTATISDRASVRQTLTMGQHTASRWSELKRHLLIDQPTLYATSLTSDGHTSIVELHGQGRLTVRGASSPGDTLWVRGGEIIGEAPELPAETIEV